MLHQLTNDGANEMKTYTIMLSYHNGKRSFINKTYRNIKADNILDARAVALAKWNKPNAEVNSSWMNV